MNRLFRPLVMVLLGMTPWVNGCRTAQSDADAPGATMRSAKTSRSNGSTVRAHAHYAAGVSHDIKGETDLAIQEFQSALAEDKEDEDLVLDVARRFLLNKKPELALEILRTAAARKNASGEIYARLGSTYVVLGRVDEAIVANQTAVKKSPLHLPGYQNLMMTLSQAKRGEEGLAVLDAGSKIPDADEDFLLGLADLYQNYALQFPSQREVVNAKALALLQRTAALKPVEPETRLRLADGLLQQGDSKTASEIYLRLQDQISDLPMIRDSVRSKLVEIFLRSDDHSRAKQQLEAILRDDPSNAQAYYLLGNLAYDEKRWADAAELQRKTLMFAPNFEQAHYDLAAAQLSSGDASGALGTLRLTATKFPATFMREYLMALAESRLKHHDEAVKHFTQAEIISKADNPRRLTGEFYFEVGVAFEQKGDKDEAARYFEKALELKSDFPEAQNYLGYMWAEEGKNLERARDLIEKALKSEPDSAAYLDSMGWVLFKLNQPQAALGHMLRAVKLVEKPDATLYDHLGDIYHALNDPGKAQEAWRKSLEVEENPTVRKKLPGSGSP